jgi:hypothetical protein
MKDTPRPLYHGERHTVPTLQEPGWVTGPEWESVEKRKILGRTGIQTPNGPAGSVSLYPLRYPGSLYITMDLKDIGVEWNGAT